MLPVGEAEAIGANIKAREQMRIDKRLGILGEIIAALRRAENRARQNWVRI
jgi:hypothetical protein